MPHLFHAGNKIESQEATEISGSYFQPAKININSEPSNVFRRSDPEFIRHLK